MCLLLENCFIFVGVYLDAGYNNLHVWFFIEKVLFGEIFALGEGKGSETFTMWMIF